jgi:MFS family permease
VRPLVGPRAAFRLIGSRAFGPYFAGNALSASGTWFQNLAASILVFRLTGSELLLGVLTFVQFAPMLFLAPWTGSAADRFDRRRLLLVTQPLAALLSGVLALVTALDLATAVLVILFGLGQGVVSAFSTPAQQALFISLVRRDDVPTAVALNSMTFNIARAVGPASAAAVIAAFGIAPAFALNGVSYLVFVGALLLVHPRRQERPESSKLRESFELLRREPRLALALVIVMTVGFASDPVNTLAPAFADAFGHPDTFSGYIIGAFGAGAVTAAFVLAGRPPERRRMVVTLTMLAGGVTAFALSPHIAPGFVFLFIGGMGYLASNTAATSFLQLGVGESQRGRIMALWSIAFLGLRPLASLVDGAIASGFGVRVAGVALSLPALAAALLLARSLPRPRRSP